MAHPDRKKQRERKKQKLREEALLRKNNLDVVDLTPFNAIKLIINSKVNIQYK